MTQQQDAPQLPEMISIDQVQAALQRSMDAEPTLHLALPKDASLLTDVFGTMRYLGATEQRTAELSLKHQEALARWLRAAGGGHVV